MDYRNTFAAILVLTLLLIGCATGYQTVQVPDHVMKSYLKDKPKQLKHLYEKVLTDGQRNRVLNNLQVGLAAMDIGEYGFAKQSFDEALSYIEALYANNERAAKARSLWYEEGMKDFKGEPYERAMAYYYRGLLYLRDSDFENARACFKSGILQDSFAEEQQKRCDFALLIFLEGWASQLLGDKDLALTAYKEVKKIRPDFTFPRWNDNVLVVVETGFSPRKVADGIGHAELKYRRGRGFQEKRVKLSIREKTYKAYPMEDIAWQAMTRGGRPVDKILEGQVQFRKTHEEIATTLTDVSSNAMLMAPFAANASNIQGASAALGLLGVAQMYMASSVKAHADTRYWKNLPDAISVFTYESSAPAETIAVLFLDGSGAELSNLGRQVKVEFKKNSGYAWTRARPALLDIR